MGADAVRGRVEAAADVPPWGGAPAPSSLPGRAAVAVVPGPAVRDPGRGPDGEGPLPEDPAPGPGRQGRVGAVLPGDRVADDRGPAFVGPRDSLSDPSRGGRAGQVP